jgi:hypothetical protein
MEETKKEMRQITEETEKETQAEIQLIRRAGKRKGKT